MAAAANGCQVTLKDIGGSLPVENVQFLAASNDLNIIPQRYIRPELETDLILDATDGAQIPIIDFSKLLDIKHSPDEVTKLGLACQNWGFFQLINHQVADELIERMKAKIQEFFRLPLEEKKAYAQPPNSMEGYGQAFVVSEEQKLDWGDMYFLATQPVLARNMTLWPTNPTTFRPALEEYSMELQRVAKILLRSIAKSLECEQLAYRFGEGQQLVRINYYPPCPHANKVLGLSPHSDAVGLTLLLQVNQVQGLQIRKNGGWLPIKPLPGAFVVNIGDIIEIMSNGEYKSIEHRAVINPEKERLSIAAFYGPSVDKDIGPVPELVKEGEELYKTLSMIDYGRLVVSSKLDGKNRLELMKL